MKRLILFLSLGLVCGRNVAADTRLKGDHFTKNFVAGAPVLQAAKTRLLYFWASWCPDCREKLTSELDGFVRKNPGLDLVTVNLDRDFDKGKSFLTEEKIAFSVIRDEEKELRKKLNVYAVPGWAVLTKKGSDWVLVKSEAGSDMAAIQQAVSKSLKASI